MFSDTLHKLCFCVAGATILDSTDLGEGCEPRCVSLGLCGGFPHPRGFISVVTWCWHRIFLKPSGVTLMCSQPLDPQPWSRSAGLSPGPRFPKGAPGSLGCLRPFRRVGKVKNIFVIIQRYLWLFAFWFFRECVMEFSRSHVTYDDITLTECLLFCPGVFGVSQASFLIW